MGITPSVVGVVILSVKDIRLEGDNREDKGEFSLGDIGPDIH